MPNALSIHAFKHQGDPPRSFVQPPAILPIADEGVLVMDAVSDGLIALAVSESRRRVAPYLHHSRARKLSITIADLVCLRLSKEFFVCLKVLKVVRSVL